MGRFDLGFTLLLQPISLKLISIVQVNLVGVSICFCSVQLVLW